MFVFSLAQKCNKNQILEFSFSNQPPAMPAQQAKNFCATFNQAADFEPFRDANRDRIKYMCYAEEFAPSTGHRHMQVYVQFLTRMTIAGIRRLPHAGRTHWEFARGTFEENKTYIQGPWTSSDGTKHKPLNPSFDEIGVATPGSGSRSDLAGVRADIDAGKSLSEVWGDHFETMVRYERSLTNYFNRVRDDRARLALADTFEDVELRGWQSDLSDALDRPADSRTVRWIFSYNGGTGKSFMASFLASTMGALVITGGRLVDMAYIYNYEPIVIFDLSRTQAPSEGRENSLDHIYSFMESLKNGRLTSTKYDSRTKVFASPHVVVFANFPPDRTKMSEDRWNIQEL